MLNSYGPIRAVAVFFESGLLCLTTGNTCQHKQFETIRLFTKKAW